VRPAAGSGIILHRWFDFCEPGDLPSLAFLKEQLEVAMAQPGVADQLRGAVTRLNERISLAKKGPDAVRQRGKADGFVLRFKGWKTHQK